MGGAPYLIPAPYTGMSSWDAHKRRNPPSSEPGVDYYMPSGTPLGAPAKCKVIAVGGSIYPATGRFVLFDDGRRWLRALHLLEWRCKVGDELEAGEIFGLSGASGYGSEFFGEPSRNVAFWRNTGGDHVHMTAFRGRAYTFGRDGRGSVDFHALTGGNVAGGGNASAGGNGDDDMPTLDEIFDAKKFRDGLTFGQTVVRTRKAAERAEINTARLVAAQGVGEFYNHGGTNITLWIYVLPSGDFVRIRDHETALLYKERNGGFRSVTLSPDAIRALVADLVAAGGRDLSAEGEIETPTDPARADEDDLALANAAAAD